MKVIGITGGVGAGKSEVIRELKKLCSCRIITADETAHELERPGQVCYQPLIELLGKEILNQDQTIDKKRMAAKIFGDSSKKLLSGVNRIVHPAVKQFILDTIRDERAAKQIDYLFIEAALLIEDGYDRICDELWYIDTRQDVREKRLQESRGYTREKIAGIMAAQSDDETFRRYCRTIIDNSGTIEDTIRQLKEKLLQS